MQTPTVSHLGTGALLFASRDPFGDAVQERVWAVADAAPAWPGVQETVPGMNNLMVVFDPAATTAADVTARVEAAWLQPPGQRGAGKLVELDVVYGGEGGPDLAEVAARAQLDIDTVVALHSAAVYQVYFLGAHPGFGYLAGLDPRLHTPRRAEPRLSAPAGTVAIGGMQAGIVAQTTPSGWQLIGRTDRRFFDPHAEPCTLLAPGDQVRFRAIGIER